MREAAFLKRNNRKWKDFEKILESPDPDPNRLAELYIELNDDLSYSCTYYPESSTTQYLNSLTSGIHQRIYRNKKESKNRFTTFWTRELPCLNARYQKQFLYAFLIFFISACIGALSAKYDDSYVRLIMGDHYVNMTLENIKKGDPMGVYKSQDESSMFMHITVNNIKVSLMTFVFGVITSFGTGYLLFHNGIMLGAFQYFFVSRGLLLPSLLSIWLHGTLEISAIIIAGAAGLVMGNSILFPGTYSRMDSFRRGAKDGMKITVGLVPVFIAAGFLESFVTRHTEWPAVIRGLIILASAAFIIYYFIVYPIILKNRNHAEEN